MINQTLSEPQIKDVCVLKATFFLPKDKFTQSYKFGNDPDNLLKRFLEALNKTIFSDAPGKDFRIISMYVAKIKVSDSEKAGVHLEILPVSI